MANEIGPIIAATGKTLYAIVHGDAANRAKVRDVVADAWDTIVDADWDDYDVALTEQGTASGIYYGDLPSGLDGDTNYPVTIHDQAGGSPDETDTVIEQTVIGPRIDSRPKQADITGGAYALDTDLNGRIRLVDGTGAGEILLDTGGVFVFSTSINAIRDAILDRVLAGNHDTAGTTGKVLQDVVGDTNELQTDWVNGGRLDLLIDAILADTGELQTDWANGGRLDLLIDAILADTGELQTDWADGGRLDLLIDAIKAVTDVFTFTGSDVHATLDGETVGLPLIDGVAFAVVMEVLLAHVLGFSTLVDNGDGTKTLTVKQQDDSTTSFTITFNVDGEVTANSIP